jgi:hypothetical protein
LSDTRPNELSFPADKFLLEQLQAHQGWISAIGCWL